MKALMAVRPGTALWLVRHELRLAWRGVGGERLKFLSLLAGLIGLGLHVGAYFLLRQLPAGALPAWATLALGAAIWIVISLMLSQAILQSVSALFDRGDLDLLLASPLPTRSVFIARGLGIAVGVVSLYLFLLAPLAHLGLFTGHAYLLAIYPSLLALALAVTALGMWLTLLLVRLLGARRARTAAQILGSLVGAALFLLTQGQNLLSPESRQQGRAWLLGSLEPGGLLAPGSPLWLPARALLGEPGPLLVVLALGLGSFWAVVQLTHQRFLAGTQEAVSGSARRGLAPPTAGSVRFRGGLWCTVLVKEWRLIWRDPQLITQTLLQLLYLVPLLVLVLRGRGSQQLDLIVPAAVWLASSLAHNLAWITVAAEDAPDLLGGAPSSLRRLRGLKVLAALQPVWLLLSPLLLYLPGQSLWLSLVFLLCLVGGTVSAGMAQLWYPRQGRRSDMKTRTQDQLGIALLEALLTLGWAGTAYCLIEALRYLPLALLVAALGSGVIWWLGRARRQDELQG